MPDVERLLQRFDLEAPGLLETHRCPGLAVAVLDGEHDTVVRTCGLADVEKVSPVTPDTVFQICSISKAVATWGALRLVDQGRLHLDAPVERYLTRWHLPDTGFDNSEVTLRRLLSHTAGVSVEGYSGISPDAPLPSLEDILEGRSPPLDEKQAAYCRDYGIDPATKHRPVAVERIPGSSWAYSGGGYMILDLLIEEVTGGPAADYLDQEVLRPLGLDRATFHIPKGDEPDLAVACDAAGDPVPHYRFPHCTAGGMSASIVDLARFVRAELCAPDSPGRGSGVISNASFDAMFQPVMFAETAGENNYYMGLGHFLGKIGGLRLAQHSGGAIGWRSIYFVVPELRQGIAVLINGSGGNEVWQSLIRMWGGALTSN